MAVSHDLATPLTSIEGYIEAIRDGFAEGNPDRMNRYLDIIDQKSRVLASRVEGLIESARMETGEWRLKHQDVRLRGYLDQTAAVFREDALVAGRQFTSSVDIDPAVVVRMDPVLVTRALENLLSNAIRYTTAGDSVAFRALAPPGAPEATIVVEDTGRGIPADELGRIFDPFYRGPPVSRGGGYGIGLSTANHVITSHGWRIDVTSAPGAGTVLAIRIPLEGSEDGASAGAEDQGAPPETRDAG
jgi:two-component system sensor histidine kinase BaeS